MNLAEIERKYSTKIILCLFVVGWIISTVIWINKSTVLIIGDKVYHIFSMVFIIVVPYVIIIFLDVFVREQEKQKFKDYKKFFDFIFGISIWIISQIVSLLEFNDFTSNIILLLTMITISGLILIFVLSVVKTKLTLIIAIILIPIFIIGPELLLLITPYSNIELWQILIVAIGYPVSAIVYIIVIKFFKKILIRIEKDIEG